MTIRSMQMEDLDQVMSIEEENFSVPWTRDGYASYLMKGEGLFLTAEEKGTVLGYCGVILMPPEGDITNVSVSLTARGRGIGRALVEEMLRQTEERGISTLFLEVRRSNAAAIHLYQKQGFTEVGVRKNYYQKPTEDALIMRRDAENDSV